MKSAGFILWGAGLVLAVWLVLSRNAADIAATVVGAGWGLLAVTLFHLAPLLADSHAWRVLIDGAHRPSLARMARSRWIGESVNGLLPAAHIGGEIVRARMATLSGVPGRLAGASVTVDLTLGVITQIALTPIGLALLIGAGRDDGGLVLAVTVGGIVIAALVAAFVAVQRGGVFRFLVGVLGRLTRRGAWPGLAAGAERLDQAVSAIYRDRRTVLVSAGWRMLGWVLGTGEVWLAATVLGQPLGLADAFMIEIMTQAVRSGAFFVPGALGVQEGGFMLLGAAIGLTPEAGLALALVKRVRELALGIPGLLAWHLAEGRRL